jgi:hypothetical protein
MNKKLEEFEERGFFVVEDFFTRQEVEGYRELCDNYFSNYPSYHREGGRMVPGWAGKTPELEELNTLHEEPRVLDVAEGVLGRPFVFAEHADLHQNKVTGWHRDVHDFKRGGGAWPNWTKDFLVIKISFLLQDHTDNGHGLWMDVGSHKEGTPRNTVAILSRPTDLIVFDQRIHHRGQQSQYRKKYNQHRYLITYGYGIDNELTAKHIAGCKSRQDKQRGAMKLPSK